jgi:hypothetical protein
MDFALHATSAKALAYQPTVENDDTDWLADVSFADLLDMRDEASEGGDWRGLDELDCELRARRAIAVARLMSLFVQAVEAKANGVLPWVEGGELTAQKISWYLHEALNTAAGTNTAVLLMLDASYRGDAIAAMAADYARDNADDLLRAGWSAP